jgi:soluble lytic murein transglycosylase-like protein
LQTPWPSSARGWAHSLPAALAAGTLMLLAATTADAVVGAGVRSDAQRDPELREVVQSAIQKAECFIDKYDSAVWFTLMEPRLRSRVKDRDERLAILQSVWCEARMSGAAPLPPGLVLAVIDVESAFDRYAVSRVGAVGLMQVMPFWPEKLGMERHQLTKIPSNIHMGCAILRFYLQRENRDFLRALGRYYGNINDRSYAGLVVNRWTRVWNGADDLGR